MRDLLSEDNLVKSAGLSAVLTLMSVGRLVQSGKSLVFYVPITFLVLIFVSGAVTAWGRCAGMPGIITERQTFRRGIGVAVVLSLIFNVIFIFWLNTIMREALLNAENSVAAELLLPATMGGRLALLLWAASFQVMFLQAAPMSLFARLSGARNVAIGLCLAFRAFIAYLQIDVIGINEHIPLVVISMLLISLTECMVFAKYGLAPTIFLAAGINLHIFFIPTFE
jgi:hypothetical protein